WLLTNVATCHSCAVGVKIKPAGGRNRPESRLYFCKNPQCSAPVARNQKHLDRYVEGRVLRRLQDPDLMDEVLAPDPGVAEEIAALYRRPALFRAAVRMPAAATVTAVAAMTMAQRTLLQRH